MKMGAEGELRREFSRKARYDAGGGCCSLGADVRRAGSWSSG